MSDIAIFIVGTFTFLLLSGGLGFTWYEVRRIDEEMRLNEAQRDRRYQ